jgi:hypothetical protein
MTSRDPRDDLTLIGEGRTYNYIGDSHAYVGHLVFRAGEDDSNLVTARPFPIRAFSARSMLDRDGNVADVVVQALMRCRAFHTHRDFEPLPGFRQQYIYYGDSEQFENLKITGFANDQAYVFVVGEVNIRWYTQRLTPDVDFPVPFSLGAVEALPAKPRHRVVSYAAVLKALADDFTPLFRALRYLRAAGLETVFLHSLPPPTPDDALAERLFKFPSLARSRYKVTMLANYLFRAVCNDIGIGFIDTWQAVTLDNILDPRYSLEGVHLNRDHALLSIQEVHRQFTALERARQETR